jgi:hypothetical protein
MGALFPKYLDRTAQFSDIRTGGKSITTHNAATFNWLAAKLVATQRGLGRGFGSVSSLSLDHGATGAEQFRQNMNARCRIEFLYIDNVLGSGTLTPNLFIHTTEDGTNQRFDPGEIKLWRVLEMWDTSSRTDMSSHLDSVSQSEILYDSRGYAYGTTQGALSYRYTWFIAIQGFTT